MPQVPFPHFLQVPKQRNNYCLRIVTDKPIQVGDVLEEEPQRLWNIEKARWYLVTHGYKCEKITTKRPAKGNWVNWPIRPTYYEISVNPELHKTVVEL